MTSTLLPARRTGTVSTMGNHEARIRALERQRFTGWRFNVFNGEGSPTGWAWLEATDSIDHNFGQLGLLLGESTGDGSQVYSRNPANTKIGAIFLTPDVITVSLSSSMAISLDRATGQVTISGPGGALLQMTDGSPDIHIPVGGNVVADLT